MADLLDRKQEPRVLPASTLLMNEPLLEAPDGGIPIYVLPGGEQEVCKIEFLFSAGSREDPDFLVAPATSALLLGGTAHSSAEEIAERIEYYGSSVDCDSSADHASVSVVSLVRFLPELLPLVLDSIAGATFPASELELYRTQCVQRQVVQDKKVGYVSRKKLNRSLFGPASPYGHYQAVEGFNKLNREQLSAFHGRNYRNMTAVVVSGKVGDKERALIASCLSAFRAASVNRTPATNGQDHKGGDMYDAWPDTMQTSLRLGRLLFDRRHPDFISMKVLNCILGGYFGSRLMANIREDKGFSYGIGSAVVPLDGTGYMYISTEVNKSSRQEALREIYREMELLREELVDEEELQLVRNYMTGMLQRGFDGPFATATSFRNVLLAGMDYGYYRSFMDGLASATPEKLRDLAARYLGKEDFWEVAVG